MKLNNPYQKMKEQAISNNTYTKIDGNRLASARTRINKRANGSLSNKIPKRLRS